MNLGIFTYAKPYDIKATAKVTLTLKGNFAESTILNMGETSNICHFRSILVLNFLRTYLTPPSGPILEVDKSKDQ